MPETTPSHQHAAVKLYNTEDCLYEDFDVGQKDRSIRRTIPEGERCCSTASCSTPSTFRP